MIQCAHKGATNATDAIVATDSNVILIQRRFKAYSLNFNEAIRRGRERSYRWQYVQHISMWNANKINFANFNAASY